MKGMKRYFAGQKVTRLCLGAGALGTIIGLACSFYPDFADRSCKIDADCPPGDICLANMVCGPAISDPANKCTPGTWYKNDRCVPCTHDEHCGEDCVDCTANDNTLGQVCLQRGQCGCSGAADCPNGWICQDTRCIQPTDGGHNDEIIWSDGYSADGWDGGQTDTVVDVDTQADQNDQ